MGSLAFSFSSSNTKVGCREGVTFRTVLMVHPVGDGLVVMTDLLGTEK